MLTLAVQNYNPGSWETIVLLGGWDVLVYAGIVTAAILFRRSVRASLVMLCGAVVVGGFSVLLLYADLSVYFVPPTPTTRVMNSAGPLLQFVLPVLQWPVLGVFVVVSYFCRRAGGDPRSAC